MALRRVWRRGQLGRARWWRAALRAGCCVVMLALLAVADRVLGQPLPLGPLAASCVLVLTIPSQPFAQPRSILAGYLLAGGLAWAHWQWRPATGLLPLLTVGLAVCLLLAADALHPPGVATLLGLLAAARPPTWHLWPALLLSVGLIIGGGWLLNKWVLRQSYPVRWW